MSFTGFIKKDFDTFLINGLEERMDAIKGRIQPKFTELGQALAEDLSMKLGIEMYLHIAKHARRTVNPPKDTWLSICANKRGYKKHPHFQVGLFDDHVFVWLAYIYELPEKEAIAKKFLANKTMLEQSIPKDFSISSDHMKKDAVLMKEADLECILTRFRDVKKAELLIGKKVPANDSILSDGTAFIDFVEKTYEQLLPIYILSTSER